MAHKIDRKENLTIMNTMRAVQFQPFNGLRGYDTMITDSETTMPKRREITEDRANMLNEKLTQLHKGDTVVITYFTSEGYISHICSIKEIDSINRCIRTGRGTIPFQDLWNIESGF